MFIPMRMVAELTITDGMLVIWTGLPGKGVIEQQDTGHEGGTAE